MEKHLLELLEEGTKYVPSSLEDALYDADCIVSVAIPETNEPAIYVCARLSPIADPVLYWGVFL